ncbi:MAG TPA: hypothetical protein VIF15_07625 [Polyangiaceae bacterium]
MTTKLSRVAGVLVGLATVTGAGTALATPGHVIGVFWQSDVTFKPQVDSLMGCLAGSSTFGTTWATQFAIAPVVFDGSTILQAAAPATLTLGGSLDQLMTNAFDLGLIPPPKPGVANEYLAFIPKGTIANDTQGATLCTGGQGICGEHSTAQYKNMQYDLALVPLDCPDCGGGLDNVTITAEHEAAEGLADQGTATYEVGDGCEAQSNITSMACCGQNYALQQLAGPGGTSDCQTITATGSACVCKAAQQTCATATECCTGLSCKPQTGSDAGTPPMACCSDLAGKCTTSADCCGALQCTAGACACVAVAGTCATTADCCTGLSCDTTKHTCVAPVPDAGSGGEPDSGSGGRADGGGLPSGADAGVVGSDGDGGDANGLAGSASAGCGCESARGSGAPWGDAMMAGLALAGVLVSRRRTR